MQDATCECSETSVRRYGLPCVHNIAHAEKAGMTAESIMHWKDTTLTWKHQYVRLEFPVPSMFNIDSSDLINPMVQYPPVVAAKPGCPNRNRHIIGGEEAVRIALRKRGKPFCGACKKWGHTKSSKRCDKYKRRVTKKK